MRCNTGRSVWPLLVVACVAVPLALAAEPRGDFDEKKEDAEEALRQAGLLHRALELEAFGVEEKAPEALITAGRLLLQLPSRPSKFDETRAKLAAAADSKAVELDSYAARAARLFTLAEEMMPRNAGVKALIAEAKKTKPKLPPGAKGNAAGPKALSRTLGAGAKDTWSFKFRKGLPAYVAVSAGQRMHIEINRPNGEQLSNVNLLSAAATFTPAAEEVWTVVVHNSLAGKPAPYTLTTN